MSTHLSNNNTWKVKAYSVHLLRQVMCSLMRSCLHFLVNVDVLSLSKEVKLTETA
jgi:hypothetical protein